MNVQIINKYDTRSCDTICAEQQTEIIKLYDKVLQQSDDQNNKAMTVILFTLPVALNILAFSAANW